MTASEVRDRLDQRFRLLVGSRRGLERHQTLRHAVAWSYDLLDDAEKTLLERCSVFAGGFDLQSACAVAGFDDPTTTPFWICWTRWCASRCSSPTGHRGGPGFRCWRRSASSPRSNSSPAARPTEVRTAHARYFAGREADIMALWDSPRQREAYDWFTAELANLRTAFRWAADHSDLDVAATIATYAAFLGSVVENYEPIAWAEELIEPARAVDHPRLAFLYVMASQCWLAGRIEAAVRYSDAGQKVDRAVAAARCRSASTAGSAVRTCTSASPNGAVEWCRAQLARGRDTHAFTRACLVVALTIAGSGDEAMAAADGLIEAAEATRNPCALSFALLAYGFAFRDADPDRALDALRRGLVIAQDSGNRYNETHLATSLCRLEAEHGDPLAALDYLALAIRNYPRLGQHHHDPQPRWLSSPLFLDRLGRHEPAATIAGFAFSPLTAAAVPEINTAIAHLRDVLGDQTYESLARKGETMTTAEMATYAYDQIDQARAELNAVSK